ncbi:hypothetical protein AAC387_Pa06g1453 [Persea americana]
MDESWRMHVGSKLPRRKSTDPTPDSAKPARFFGSESGTLDPSDFDDVFGGPPRSVFLRRFSGDFSASFYDEIFRPSDAPSRKGRNLPVFRVPAAHRRSEDFYDDIFGAGEDRRSRSRSKSNSSSVLSSEDLSPLGASGGDDVGFSSFASKLRPITIPSRQSSSSTLSREQKKQTAPSCNPSTRPHFMEYQFPDNSHFGFSHRVSSPETISLEPSSYRSVKISVDDIEIESPLSDISYGGHDPDLRNRIEEKSMQEQEEEQGDGDFLLGSYVIEIASDKREDIDEAVAVEDAIAWVREKSQARKSEDSKQPNVMGIYMENGTETEQRVKIDQGMQVMMELQAHPRRDFETTHFLMAELSGELKRRDADEEANLPDKEMEFELLEEDIKNWSAGKEGNIRSLLSTLQYILWPGSGWHAISLTNIIETSQVKKAYQKARLCLHPDKLQQKGATTPQKYKAEKVFALLQDAWATFNSHDIFSG